MTNRDEGETGQQNTRPARLIDVLRREFQRLVRLACGSGLDRTRVEDVLQDVFMQALKHNSLELTEPKALAWLMRTTVNRCKLEFRQDLQRKKLCQTMAACLIEQRTQSRDTSLIAIQDERIRHVTQALFDLEPDLLNVLVMKYFCDMTSVQISDTLGVSASAIRTRLQKARYQLAQTLIKQGVEP